MNAKVAVFLFTALAVWLMWVLIQVLGRLAPEDPEVLYQEQLKLRGYSGEIQRQQQFKAIPPRQPTVLDHEYNEKVRRIIASRAVSSRVVIASWYGGDDGFVGKCKANGEFYNDARFTVAHRELPLGTLVALERGGKFVLAMVTDRGPYVQGRDLDVSRAIADRLGIGVTPVTMYILRIPSRDITYHQVNRRCLKI